MENEPQDDLFEDLETDLDAIQGDAGQTGEASDDGDAEEPGIEAELDENDQEALEAAIRDMSAEDFSKLVAKARGEVEVEGRDERLLELEAGSKEALAERRAQEDFDYAAANALMREFREDERRRAEAEKAIRVEAEANTPDPQTQAEIEALIDLPTEVFLELSNATAMRDPDRIRSIARRYGIPVSLLETL